MGETMLRFQILFLTAAALAVAASPVVIRNAKVFDGTRVLGITPVLIENGRIAAVGAAVRAPDGAGMVDGTGMTLLPGLIDAHVHTRTPEDLRTGLGFGVTTYLDMFTLQEMAARLRAEQRAGKAGGRAELFSAGTLVTTPGGHGTEYGVSIPTLARAQDAQAFVDARIAEGSDYIKLIKDDGSAFGFERPTLDRATLAAVIRAAHARRKLAVVHIATAADAREALAEGADVIAHAYAGRPDPDIAREAARRGVHWTPTLVVMGQGEGPSAVVRDLYAAGVSILAGTDAPNPGAEYGATVHAEMEALVKAGLSTQSALAAATSRPAAAFRLRDRGRIAPGLRADLVLVEGDPLRDIRSSRRIAGVWLAGVRVVEK
jgi:imidazolonepropionase-like amidohydrolase